MSYNKKTVEDIEVKGKKVLVRCDFNVPLKDGVIADFTATKLLLKNLLERVCKRYNAIRPRVLVGVPSGITEVEERAVEEAIIRAGAR